MRAFGAHVGPERVLELVQRLCAKQNRVRRENVSRQNVRAADSQQEQQHVPYMPIGGMSSGMKDSQVTSSDPAAIAAIVVTAGQPQPAW